MNNTLTQKVKTRTRMVSEAQAELIGLVAHEAARPIKKSDVVPDYLQTKDWNKAKTLALDKGLICSDGAGKYWLGTLPHGTIYKCREWMGTRGTWTGTAGTAVLQYAELIMDLLWQNMFFRVRDIARIIGCPETLFEDVMLEVKGNWVVEAIDLPEVLTLIDEIRYSGMFDEEYIAVEEEEFFSSCYNDMKNMSFNENIKGVLA